MRAKFFLIFCLIFFVFFIGCKQQTIKLPDGGSLEITNAQFAKEGTFTLMTGIFQDLGISNEIPWQENACPDNCPVVKPQGAMTSNKKVYSFSVYATHEWSMASQGIEIETGMIILNIMPGKNLPPLIPQDQLMLNDNTCKLIIQNKWRTGAWVTLKGRGIKMTPDKELLRIIAIPFEDGVSSWNPGCEPSWFRVEKTQIKVVEIPFLISGVETKYPISSAGIWLNDRERWGYLFHEPGNFFPGGVVDEESTDGLYVQNMSCRYIPPPLAPPTKIFSPPPPPKKFSLANIVDNKTVFLNKKEKLIYVNYKGKNYTMRVDSFLNPPENKGKLPTKWGSIK